MKTIKERLSKLPSPYKEAAVMGMRLANNPSANFTHATMHGVSWISVTTMEFVEVNNILENHELLNKL